MISHPHEKELNKPELEPQAQAVCQFLEAIANRHQCLTLLHSRQSILRQDLYVPIQVTLERQYRHEIETFWGYAESEVELRHTYIPQRLDVQTRRRQVSWEEAKRQHQRLMVLADPGMGKSSLLRLEAQSTAQRERQKLLAGETTVEAVVFPLFLRLADLQETGEEISDAIPQLVQRDYPQTWTGIAPRFEEKLRTGRCWLLLNALDEVPKADRAHLSQKLNRFARDYPCPIICTSRLVGYGGAFLDGAKEVEIVPFSLKQAQQFIQTWFETAAPERAEAAEPLIQHLRINPQIRAIAQNPRLLYLLCSLYCDPELTLPTHHGQIYQKTVEYLLEQWSRTEPPPSRDRIAGKIRLLETLAYYFTCQDKDIFSAEELTHQIEAYRQNAPATLQNSSAAELLAELTQGDRILQKLTPEGNRYVFIHRVTQDYLSAAYLNRILSENLAEGIALAKQHLWEYHWHPSLSLLAGLMDEPVPLLNAIAQEKDDIFSTLLLLSGRCLAECQEIPHPLSTEIIDKIEQVWRSYPFVGFIESTVVALGQTHAQILQRIQATLEQRHYYTRKDFVIAAIAALGQIGSPQAADILIRAIAEGPWYVRGAAAVALGRIGDPQTVSALVPVLNDTDNYVRGAAAEALGVLGGSEAVAALVPALRDEDAYVRQTAAISLAQIGSPEAFEGLAKVLNHEDCCVRWEATGACRITNPAVVAALGKALNHPDDRVKEEAAMRLSRIGSPEAVEALIPALQSCDRIVREEAAHALSQLGTPETLEALIPALRDSDSLVREEAARALGRIGNPQVVERLIPALNDRDREVRKRAVEALGDIGGAQAVEGLIAVLNDEDGDVRGEAALELGRIGNAAVVEALMPLLGDKDWFVREQAALALSRVGTSQTLEKLLPLPTARIYRPEILALLRTLAVRCDREKSPWIPVYPELVGSFGILHRLWRQLAHRQKG